MFSIWDACHFDRTSNAPLFICNIMLPRFQRFFPCSSGSFEKFAISDYNDVRKAYLKGSLKCEDPTRAFALSSQSTARLACLSLATFVRKDFGL